jgi:hypothetical protein
MRPNYYYKALKSLRRNMETMARSWSFIMYN